MGGGGTTYDYGFRIYNPQIGKFLSVDPLTRSYPMLTPYQFASNSPISGIDVDGLEFEWAQSLYTTTMSGYNTTVKTVNQTYTATVAKANTTYNQVVDYVKPVYNEAVKTVAPYLPTSVAVNAKVAVTTGPIKTTLKVGFSRNASGQVTGGLTMDSKIVGTPLTNKDIVKDAGSMVIANFAPIKTEAAGEAEFSFNPNDAYITPDKQGPLNTDGALKDYINGSNLEEAAKNNTIDKTKVSFGQLSASYGSNQKAAIEFSSATSAGFTYQKELTLFKVSVTATDNNYVTIPPANSAAPKQ